MVTREEALADPKAANAAVEKVLKQATAVERPHAEMPPFDQVELPGGLVRSGEVIRMVRVQELTGKHEEALARAAVPPAGSTSINWTHFLQVLLESGVTAIDGVPKDEIPNALKDMYVGDRDAIILAIRAATYGDELELENWVCPNPQCRVESSISLSVLNDIGTIRMEDPRGDGRFKVKLRKGRTAEVRLATGRDVISMFERETLTAAERESILLSRCLLSIIEADGKETLVQGFGGGVAMELSIPDRRAILREMDKRQPGPRYNEVTFVHEECKKEVPVAVGLGELFPDLF